MHGRQIAPVELGRCADCRRPIPIGAGICSPANCAKCGSGATLSARSETWRRVRCSSSWRNRGGWSCPCADAIRPTYQRARAVCSRARSFLETGAPGPAPRPVTMETSKCLLPSNRSFPCENRCASTFSWSGLYMEGDLPFPFEHGPKCESVPEFARRITQGPRIKELTTTRSRLRHNFSNAFISHASAEFLFEPKTSRD